MTKNEERLQRARDASRKEIASAMNSIGRPARATEIAAKSGISVRGTTSHLFAMAEEGSALRYQGEGYRAVVTWELTTPSRELPPEYMKVQSIFRVAERVARLVGVHA